MMNELNHTEISINQPHQQRQIQANLQNQFQNMNMNTNSNPPNLMAPQHFGQQPQLSPFHQQQPPSYPTQMQQYPQYYPQQQFQGMQPSPPPQPIIYQTKQSQVQYIQYGPTCFQYALMLPFPFFCIGCCIAKTTSLYFDKKTRMARIQTYSGMCSCCAEEINAPFSQIRRLALVKGTLKMNKKATYVLTLFVKDRQIQLRGNQVKNDAEPVFRQLANKMKRCQIQFQEKFD